MSLFGDDVKFPNDGREILSEDENAVIDKLAKFTVRRGMSVPAILFLESIKPLNFIASQVLVFFQPIISMAFNLADYDHLRTALEKRESVEILLQRVEKYDAVEVARDRRIKKYLREQKKSWKWYQRYLGLFEPKVTIPEEILNRPEPPHTEGDGPKPPPDTVRS